LMTSDRLVLKKKQKRQKPQNHKKQIQKPFSVTSKISFIYRGTCIRQKQKGGKTGTGVKRKKPAPDSGKADTLLPIT